MSDNAWVPMGILLFLFAMSFVLGMLVSPAAWLLVFALTGALLIRWTTIRYP